MPNNETQKKIFLWVLVKRILSKQHLMIIKHRSQDSFKVPQDFPSGPVVRNPPCNAGDVGLIPDQGTRIPHAVRHLNLYTTTKGLMKSNK